MSIPKEEYEQKNNDEYLTSDDIKTLIQAKKEYEAVETISLENLKRELEL